MDGTANGLMRPLFFCAYIEQNGTLKVAAKEYSLPSVHTAVSTYFFSIAENRTLHL
jgi:hypothetical protein